MAPRLAEVCHFIIDGKFGLLAANVFACLACHGRLPFLQLQRITGLSARGIKSVLLILINHNLVLWHQADENEPTYYQVDWHAAYVLVRQAKLLRLVEQTHGKAARLLMQGILSEGKKEVADLEDQQVFDMASPRDSGIGMMDEQGSEDGHEDKATGDDHINTPASFHDTLRALLEDGFLCKSTARDHIPVAELEEELRAEIIASDPTTFKDGKTTGAKSAASFVTAANSLKRKWQDDAEFSEHRDVASHGTIKHGKAGGSKRRKVGGNLTDGLHDFHDDDDGDIDVTTAESSVRRLPHDLCLRINYHKSVIALRSKRLESMAEMHLGPMSSAVYGGLLRAAEGRTHSSRSQLRVRSGFSIDEDGEAKDNAEITIADTELVDFIDKGLDLRSSIKDTSTKQPDENSKNKKRRMVPDDDEDIAALGIKREVDSDEEDAEPIVNGIETVEHRQKRLNLIGMHLDLIGESPKNFLQRNVKRRTSTISFAALSGVLAKSEIDRMIVARSGQIGLRVCRILREKGKLQDTQIASHCLKRIKDLRAILTNLQSLGFIDVQEMPRDNYRQPSRTVYLWYFNEHDIRQNLLQQTYQGMSRAMARLETEKARNKDIIEKAESVDWDMKRLNKPERDLLTQWYATEDTLTAAIDRLDDVVMVLRDFDETDTSLLT